MSVYVDDMKAPHGRLVMCHMIADTRAELMGMVARIGVDPKWVQKTGTYQEHFDIALSKRRAAVAAGAIEVSRHDLVRRCMARRVDGALAAYLGVGS